MAVESLDITIEGETLTLEIGTVPASAPGGSTSVHNELTSRDAADAHPQSAITGLAAALAGKEPADPAIQAHIANVSNPHNVTAVQVGADPAGTATSAVAAHAAAASAHPMSGVDGLAAALALLAPLLSPALTGTPTAPTAAPGTASTQIASTAFVAAAIAALLNSTPGALDTLDELAAALGDDPNFATTVTNALAGKLTKAANLADLVDAAAARTNLGATTIGGQVFTASDAAAIRSLLSLGAAALLGVGTTAGTVAAGDDSRFTAAIDASRLPTPTTTALGGVKRNTGSAGQFVTGIDADGTLLRDTPAGGSPGGSTGQAQYNNAGAFGELPLWRTDANTVSQHNGTTAQTTEIFNTRIDASNWEKASIKWSSNVLEFSTAAAGTGVQRNIRIKAASIEHELTAACWLKYIYPGDARVFCDLSRSIQYRVNGNNNSLVILGTGNGSTTLPIVGTSWYGTSVGFSSTGFHVCPSAFTFGRSTFSAVETGTLNTNLSADPFTVTYGAPDAGATAAKIVGHNVAILAGSGSSGASGAANGGSVNIDGGRGYGTGTDGDIIIGATRGVLRLPIKTVATLPGATSAGRRCFVSDATATTFYSVVTGGGSNFVPVFSDGTTWRIG